MIIKIDEVFEKDFKKLSDSLIRNRIITKLNELEGISSLINSSGVKKMKGFPNFYRIRIGDYRIGLKLDDTVVTILRVRHRKDIYRIFP